METRVATRYARAFINASKQVGAVAEAEQDLRIICDILQSRADFKELLESPRIPREQKLSLIDRLFADRARPVTLRLLRLLIEKGRADTLQFIYAEFLRLKNEMEGVLKVDVLSAVPLTDNELRAIVAKLEAQTRKRIETKTTVDPSLIGGIAVKYCDNLLDGTVKAGLRRLKEKFYLDVLKQT